MLLRRVADTIPWEFKAVGNTSEPSIAVAKPGVVAKTGG